MHETDVAPLEYRCPGAAYAISRAVHLGRLAAFDPVCRTCPHRGDRGGLSPRRERWWAEVEAIEGDYETRGPSPAAKCQMSTSAFGLCLRRGAFHGGPIEEPAVVLASDGEPRTAELVAAADEGLRLAGCNVVDIGPASAAAVRFAIDHLGTDAGVLVAAQRSKRLPMTVRYWAPGATPLDESGGQLIAEQVRAGIDRPRRRNGQSRRFDATTPYLDTWRDSYHGLRPLRIALECASLPVRRYLDALLSNSACRVIDVALGEHPAERITATDAHLGIRIDRFGELVAAFDERGVPLDGGALRPVPTDAAGGLDDGIVVLTALLQLLSRSDRPLSVALGASSIPLPSGEG